MKPGHPYLTEDFDLKRSLQRRILRELPDYVLRRYAPAASAARLEEPRRARLEAQLRRLADEVLEEAEGAYDYYEHALGWIGVEAREYFGRRADAALAQEGGWDGVVAIERKLSRETTEPEPPAGEALHTLVLALTLADELAEDGYRDDRLPDAV